MPDMHGRKILSAMMALALAVLVTAGFPAVTAHAAGGTVYTCTVNRCYAHPVTGTVEDSGGASSYATGQGMVEGCVYGTGIFELTDDGAYYLTIRLSLMDYTSGHSFWVQNVGDSGWSTPSEMGITQTGADSNGSTADICIRVPSENCIVRAAMYVEPMGRDVIFYFYPSDYSEGNNTDMTPGVVTADSGAADSSEATGSASSETTGDSSLPENSSLESSESTAGENSGNGSLESSASTTEEDSGLSSAKTLENSITEAAAPAAEEVEPDTDSSTLDSALGLSLSTAEEVESVDNADEGTSSSSGNRIFQTALAVVTSGLILIAAAAGVVYYFRKNWKRWGGADDDEE